jgi:hypothetical protein
MMAWFRHSKKEQDFTIDPLEGEVEHLICIQQGLLATLQIIVFQRELWQDLCAELFDEMGLVVQTTDEARQKYKDLYAQLRASMVVLAESHDFPIDNINLIGTDEL